MSAHAVLDDPIPSAATVAADRSKLLPKNQTLFSIPTPQHMVKGEGAVLINSAGAEFVDLMNNVAHVGHGNAAVAAAVGTQLMTLNTNSRFLSHHATEYAKELLKHFPGELGTDSVVFFVNSGSEANDLALRIARAAAGATTDNAVVACLDHAYHGITEACINISPYKFNNKGGDGCPARTIVCDAPDRYRGVYRPADASAEAEAAVGHAYADDLAAAIDAKMATLPADHKFAAFIAESYLGCGGQILAPSSYLERAYAHVRARGGICIADEVQTGFGRVGSGMWAFELACPRVVPDIVTLGKPMGNGYPVSAVVCRRALAASFANGMEFFSTFGGANGAAVAARAVLREVEDRKLQAHALAAGKTLLKELKAALLGKHKCVGDVRGHGLFVGIELVAPGAWQTPHAVVAANGDRVFVPGNVLPKANSHARGGVLPCARSLGAGPSGEDGEAKVGGGPESPVAAGVNNSNAVTSSSNWFAPATRKATAVVRRLAERGFLVSTDGPYSNVLKIKPPMVITEAQLVAFVRALDAVLTAMEHDAEPVVEDPAEIRDRSHSSHSRAQLERCSKKD